MSYELYQRALKEKGQHEVLGASHNARIVEYHTATSLGASDDETPWCASFVNWVLQQEGITGTNSAAARSFVNWGVESELELGAIVVLKRGTKAWQGHVGFLYSSNDEYVELLGGNQSDSVNVTRFDRSDVIAVRKQKTPSQSNTIRVASAGGIAAAIQMLSEAEGMLGDLANQFDWAHYLLSGVSIASVLFVIYDRHKRLIEHGQ
jgi:uncharacterized protein (TIGR02594 family)